MAQLCIRKRKNKAQSFIDYLEAHKANARGGNRSSSRPREQAPHPSSLPAVLPDRSRRPESRSAGRPPRTLQDVRLVTAKYARKHA
ncbi:hypothetical protein GUJ93_ZPchr0001g32528 [Zizania palustris]|uniref:Uncharacterized protein n=1 Tax=Zizania palustris TaxID=103762 RepID=A0A8J5SFQ6_ZIZPA|nr:hypothetical protein GUJ93_ZPchr0001g32528 [Zizania palustris]